jgi:hypothetical protein
VRTACRITPLGSGATAAARNWRITFDIRSETNGSTSVLCRESSLHKSRVNEDIRSMLVKLEAAEEQQTNRKMGKNKRIQEIKEGRGKAARRCRAKRRGRQGKCDRWRLIRAQIAIRK